jgi:spore germination protein GerM
MLGFTGVAHTGVEGKQTNILDEANEFLHTVVDKPSEVDTNE